MGMTKKWALHLGLGSIFAMLPIAITHLYDLIFPDTGWSFLTVLYYSIVFFQILYYYLTTYSKPALTIVSFVVNFTLWVAEQVNLEKSFQDTAFYNDSKYRIAVVLLGGLLWSINKLLIDRAFIFMKAKLALNNRIERMMRLK